MQGQALRPTSCCRWGPRSEWVEVFIIPTETTPITYPQAYFGLYMGGEKIWRDKHRVDIAKYDPHVDATGVTGLAAST